MSFDSGRSALVVYTDSIFYAEQMLHKIQA